MSASYLKHPDRFWARVAVTADTNKCWEWQGATNKTGYGVSGRGKGKHCLAHRLAFELFYGHQPRLWVLHSCDNPPCVNPHHLREGTPSDNTRDAYARGRADKKGERNPNAKITEQDVIAIRKSTLSDKELSKIYGLNYRICGHIRTGKAWKHIPISTKEGTANV
jgi:hypothetical protein